ncbi:unnamed protein product [Moneuplotes crassus]|uniref:Uncharacterized protein n=1 Tax=Euplotes crassus TaxID=5936 RepID=A0AAD1XRG2_EUPCR|nr:unnamed protein product [Moneuplotes crassus]
MNDFEKKAIEMEKERGRIPAPSIPKDGQINTKVKDYNFNQYLPEFDSYTPEHDKKEIQRIENLLGKQQKKGYSFPTESIEDPELEFGDHPLISQNENNVYKPQLFKEMANLPGKKRISTKLLSWNTTTKAGPNGMKIPIKLVQVHEEENLKRISEPKLKDYLTIDDIKIRASILAYAKYSHQIEAARAAKIKKTCLWILAIAKCKVFIKKLKLAVKKSRMKKDLPK